MVSIQFLRVLYFVVICQVSLETVNDLFHTVFIRLFCYCMLYWM